MSLFVESNQAELHGAAVHPKTLYIPVDVYIYIISGAMAKFPAKLGAQVGVGGKFTTREVC